MNEGLGIILRYSSLPMKSNINSVPKGGVLSPLLFYLYIRDLPQPAEVIVLVSTSIILHSTSNMKKHS